VVRTRTGFTLIELMVVVAIIGIVAAAIIPRLLKTVDGTIARKQAATTIQQAPLVVRAIPEIVGSPTTPPEVEQSDLTVTLDAYPVIEGWNATTAYSARFDGMFRIRNLDRTASTIDLQFPFPPGITEVRDATLVARSPGEKTFKEPTSGIRYSTEGIHWSAAVPPGQVLEVRVGYRAAGEKAFRYQAATSGRTGALRMTLHLPTIPDPVVPITALPITRIVQVAKGSRLDWDLKNLITDRAIVVKLPATQSPLGRLILLARLAGLAILLFGAGFWYLAEGYQPGILKDFRFPQLLLLASTFFIYFPLVAVAGLTLGQPVAFIVGALVSLPLVSIHVARFTNRRFVSYAVGWWVAYDCCGVLCRFLGHDGFHGR